MCRQITNELRISAKAEKLDEVISYIGGVLDESSCSEGVRMKISIAAEEIFVNIARYAYPEGNGEAVVRAGITYAPEEITITFIDRGVKYDPLARPDPDLKLPADKRPVGGLGIYMTKQFMDELSYVYTDGKNIITMKKKLN